MDAFRDQQQTLVTAAAAALCCAAVTATRRTIFPALPQAYQAACRSTSSFITKVGVGALEGCVGHRHPCVAPPMHRRCTANRLRAVVGSHRVIARSLGRTVWPLSSLAAPLPAAGRRSITKSCMSPSRRRHAGGRSLPSPSRPIPAPIAATAHVVQLLAAGQQGRGRAPSTLHRDRLLRGRGCEPAGTPHRPATDPSAMQRLPTLLLACLALGLVGTAAAFKAEEFKVRAD